MLVLSNYLTKHVYYPTQIKYLPSDQLGIVVVIPCYNEENITGILQSLYDCIRPHCDVEVIVVVNAPQNADLSVRETNRMRISDFYKWTETHADTQLKYYVLNFEHLPEKDAGVGLARKLGMDEAVHRFLLCQNPVGVIANIDSDCTCSRNYLTALENEFRNKKTKACSIRFEHPIEGNEYPKENYESIVQYELYLHYYVLSLRRSGHPFAFHTIGSSFAVRANAYAMQGGMNKRKAGEDFYFLQKVIPLGGFTELNKACVYPAPRSSVRVPFGTGASIEKMLKTKQYNYETYDLKAFDDLQRFFSYIEAMYVSGDFTELLKKIEEPLHSFLIENDFLNRIHEIQKNTATKKAFMQRFFRWFNAFIVLKYMNYSHNGFYHKKPVQNMAMEFIKKYNPDLIPISGSAVDLLTIFRKLY